MRQIKVGDKCKQIKWNQEDNPICVITKIEGDTIWHKHEGKNYSNRNDDQCRGFDSFELIETEVFGISKFMDKINDKNR